jgi:cytidine deaminase
MTGSEEGVMREPDPSPALTPEEEARLMAAAREAMARAYAPYSHFPVGAAVMVDAGRIVQGVNVENASYPLALCAERTAVASAIAAGLRMVRAVAVASLGEPPATPCGACRQVLAEFNPTLIVLVGGPAGPWARYGLDELLPHPFLHGGAPHGL